MNKPDILIYMSDQHSPLFSGWGEIKVDTPNLDKLRENGTSFEECYTSCPLCVPARMSMLTGKLPDKTGVYSNMDTLSDMMPTFLYPFVEAGYETVFVGRMHFIGEDQRHGFTKRLIGDITPVSWNRPTEKLREERGVFCQAFGEPWCLDVIGGGESPVQEYDRAVVETALRYLEEDHEKPQLIFVGTYAPHFPYVAPENLYKKYLEKVEIPETFDHSLEMNPLLEKRKRNPEREWVKQTRAAYCGMVEKMDGQIGMVREAFTNWAKKRGNAHIFCYLSDHGDQVGEHRMFGKQTFFEKSSKIPMIFEGSDIQRGKKVVSPTSIMDLGPTLCSLAGVPFDIDPDGKDVSGVLLGREEADPDRMAVSEFMEGNAKAGFRFARMLRMHQWKLISYHGFEDQDLLFDLSQDPKETCNVIRKYPGIAAQFRKAAGSMTDPKEQEQIARGRAQMQRWKTAWEKETGIPDEERWKDNPPWARDYPKVR